MHTRETNSRVQAHARTHAYLLRVETVRNSLLMPRIYRQKRNDDIIQSQEYLKCSYTGHRERKKGTQNSLWNPENTCTLLRSPPRRDPPSYAQCMDNPKDHPLHASDTLSTLHVLSSRTICFINIMHSSTNHDFVSRKTLSSFHLQRQFRTHRFYTPSTAGILSRRQDLCLRRWNLAASARLSAVQCAYARNSETLD